VGTDDEDEDEDENEDEDFGGVCVCVCVCSDFFFACFSTYPRTSGVSTAPSMIIWTT